MPRAVLDTMVFVRSLINPHSLWGRVVFDYADRYTLVLSAPVVREILEVLARPRVRRKFRTVAGRDPQRILALLAEQEVVEITEVPAVSRDVKEDKFVATALAGHADYVVSEDQDLRAIGEYEGIHMIDTATFVRILERAEGEQQQP